MKVKSLIFIICISFFIVSCDKDDEKNLSQGSHIEKGETPEEKPEEKYEYYVNYKLTSTTLLKHQTVKIEVVTEKGLEKMEVPKNWEGTFGPFHDLITVGYKVESINSGNKNITYNGKISTCRGNQPYILKKDVTVKDKPFEIWYTVVEDDLK